jgi:hypothetical protein
VEQTLKSLYTEVARMTAEKQMQSQAYGALASLQQKISDIRVAEDSEGEEQIFCCCLVSLAKYTCVRHASVATPLYHQWAYALFSPEGMTVNKLNKFLWLPQVQPLNNNLVPPLRHRTLLLRRS